MGFLGGLGKLIAGGNPLVGIGMGLLGGGLSALSKGKDPSLEYAYSKGDRTRLAGGNAGIQGRIQGADPSLYGGRNATNHPFWGGEGAWTTTRDLGIGGGDIGNMLRGAMGGGGHASAGRATGYGYDAALMDRASPIYSLEMPEQQRQRQLAKSNEYIGGQASGDLRRLDDIGTAGGSAASPVMLSLKSATLRNANKARADAMRDMESGWFDRAGNYIHDANTTDAGAKNVALKTKADNDTSASIATAGNETSASATNASLGANQADLMGRLGLGLIGARQEDERNMYGRYGLQNDMTNSQLSPVGTNPGSQSGFQRFLAGAGAGLNMYGQMGGNTNFFGKRGTPSASSGLGGGLGSGVGASSYMKRFGLGMPQPSWDNS